MRGSRPLTHPSLLSGHRQHRQLVPVGGQAPAPPPPPPGGLLPGTRTCWRRLWRSNVATAWNRDTDLVAITRYILNLDKWVRYEELVARMPMVKVAKGQLRANPLASRMDALEGQLRFTEEQYGLTPASRLRLGLEIVEHRRSLHEELRESLLPRDYDPGKIIDLDYLE